jgi:hypothetical protein
VDVMTRQERGKLINELALVGIRRELTSADLEAVLCGIGAGLRMLHSGVLREEVP